MFSRAISSLYGYALLPRRLHHVPCVQQAIRVRSFVTASFQYRAMGEERVTSFATVPVSSDLVPNLKKPAQQILWIGCSDSCLHETNVLDLPRDEMIVHRNMGNMIISGDLSCETAIKYAVSDLHVSAFSLTEPNRYHTHARRWDISSCAVIMDAGL